MVFGSGSLWPFGHLAIWKFLLHTTSVRHFRGTTPFSPWRTPDRVVELGMHTDDHILQSFVAAKGPLPTLAVDLGMTFIALVQ